MATGEFEKLRIISYTDPDFSDEHKGEEYRIPDAKVTCDHDQ